MNYLDQGKISENKEGNNGRVLTHGCDISRKVRLLEEVWLTHGCYVSRKVRLPEGSKGQASTSLNASNPPKKTSFIFLFVITEAQSLIFLPNFFPYYFFSLCVCVCVCMCVCMFVGGQRMT